MASEPEIEKLTLAVEDCCPVAKAMGFEGMGEGIVWRCLEVDNFRARFKSKGPKHAVAIPKEKVRDAATMNAAELFVESFITEARLEQVSRKLGSLSPTYFSVRNWGVLPVLITCFS